MKSRPLLLAGVSLALLATPALAYNGPTSTPAQPAPVTSTAPATQRTAPAAATTPATHSATSNTRESRHASLYRRAEQKLKDMGLYSGAVDGVRNPQYVRALESFQRSHNIHVNGRLTRETMRALGI